jgi:hypothetical protein
MDVINYKMIAIRDLSRNKLYLIWEASSFQFYDKSLGMFLSIFIENPFHPDPAYQPQSLCTSDRQEHTRSFFLLRDP